MLLCVRRTVCIAQLRDPHILWHSMEITRTLQVWGWFGLQAPKLHTEDYKLREQTGPSPNTGWQKMAKICINQMSAHDGR